MDREQNNNVTALAYTLSIYGIILTLCYLTYLSIPYTVDQIELGGLEVNYGSNDKGSGDDYTHEAPPSSSPKLNHKLSSNSAKEQRIELNHSVNKSTESKPLVTQNNEAADEIKEAVKKGEKDKPSKNSANINPNPQPKPPKIDHNALYPGPRSKGSGAGDGNSNQAGNQGTLSGNVLSNNYSNNGGNGSGKASGNGGKGFQYSLVGRKCITRPALEDDGQTEGKIVVTIHVDKDGNVISAEAGARGTNIQNEDLWNKCEEAVSNAKFNKINSGSDMQTGNVVFFFKLQ